ncbi:MAG: GTP-binding protein [Planctomycetota bacterium]|nr:MAG: GTP-binding protein [Planctomycetota bacterium]
MQPLSLTDTIVALSTAWRPAPLGIVRISGPQAFQIAARACGLTPPHGEHRPRSVPEILDLEDIRAPADVLWFFAPRSYTGQDLVELHTIGSLPLLRIVCERLLAAGARRAGPGEFTARAFLNGRLTADAVDDVASRINARTSADLQRTSRRSATGRERLRATIEQRILELLALVEAGIDFVDEEDIRLVTPAEAAGRIDSILDDLDSLRDAARSYDLSDRPHIALAGLPNAGKSTLFNALVGSQRAIVSPVIGTTRDVISAEIDIAGRTVVLQDCAGLGGSPGEIELAAFLQAERAADAADLVMWVHRNDAPWSADEENLFRGIDHARRLLVISQSDRPAATDPTQPTTADADVVVSALQDRSVDHLRDALASRLERIEDCAPTDALQAISDRLRDAHKLLNLAGDEGMIPNPELLAAELRDALERLSSIGRSDAPDRVLGLIYSRFCVGK